MILPPEVLNSRPRKVAPRGIVYALFAMGALLVAMSCVLFFDCSACRERSPKTTLALIAVLDGMVLIPLVVLPSLTLRREARLLKWGVATSAKIVSRSIATGRDGNTLILAYEFADEAGRTRVGSRVWWGNIESSGVTADPKILDALAAPIVFYDRDDSATHLFHSGGFAEIAGLPATARRPAS